MHVAPVVLAVEGDGAGVVLAHQTGVETESLGQRRADEAHEFLAAAYRQPEVRQGRLDRVQDDRAGVRDRAVQIKQDRGDELVRLRAGRVRYRGHGRGCVEVHGSDHCSLSLSGRSPLY